VRLEGVGKLKKSNDIGNRIHDLAAYSMHAPLKLGKDPKFPQNIHSISLLSTTGKPFEKVILKIVQRYIEERDLLTASQFGFHAHHSTMLHYMRLTDHMSH
jgi:hypothetical protein